MTKLREEIEEFAADYSLEELADIQEVIYALCEATSKTPEELETVRESKVAERGGFSKRIFLKAVEDD